MTICAACSSAILKPAERNAEPISKVAGHMVLHHDMVTFIPSTTDGLAYTLYIAMTKFNTHPEAETQAPKADTHAPEADTQAPEENTHARIRFGFWRRVYCMLAEFCVRLLPS